MKKLSSVAGILFLIFIMSSCINGYTVDLNSFRSVADFNLPTEDNPTGSAIFTASVTTKSVPAEDFETIDEQTRFLTIKNPEAETIVILNLVVSGLQANEFGNVKVTATYTPNDAASSGLVKEILFDSYKLMVFAPPNPLLQYEPDKSAVKIQLNTASVNQSGIITFKFEYAQSVYSSKCINELAVFIATSNIENPKVLYSRIHEKIDNPNFQTTNTYLEFSGVLTDSNENEQQNEVIIPVVMELLNVTTQTELTLRPEGMQNIQITNIAPRIEGKKGLIEFSLVFPAGGYDSAGIAGECLLIVESSPMANGLPFTVKFSTLRKSRL